VNKENYFPVQIDYYHEDDPEYHIKRLKLTDIQMIEGIPTAMRMEMFNLQDNTSTVSQYTEVTYNIELDDAMFTERGLKK